MIYITTLIAAVVIIFLIGLTIQLIRMEKNLIEMAIYIEHKVSRIIRPSQKEQNKK